MKRNLFFGFLFYCGAVSVGGGSGGGGGGLWQLLGQPE
jgi:hypothetical protein